MISLQVNVRSFQEKRVVTVLGFEMIIRSAKQKGNEEEDENEEKTDEGDDEDEEANEGDMK